MRSRGMPSSVSRWRSRPLPPYCNAGSTTPSCSRMFKPALHDDLGSDGVERRRLLASGSAAGATRGKPLRGLLRRMAFIDEPDRQAVALLEFGGEGPRHAAVALLAVVE